ncbi:MAG TPA: DNA-processing protein DprA [Thermoanaerobaculia bacterium]|nr:DNA-processing protein DprA [Thermoanaerobaculia bacterium]
MTNDTQIHHPTPAERRQRWAELAIALWADREIGPAVAARLAADPARWTTHRAPPLAALARALGVPRDDLARARALTRRASPLAAAERRRAEAVGGYLLTRHDDGYPRCFHDLSLPPPVLAVAGDLPPGWAASGTAVAMVGSRRADGYALEVAERFARELAASGLPVVSGFARGVDAAAHRGALAAGGTTIAVLGCGLDVPYPRTHARLRREMLAGGGALLSEFPCGSPPIAWHFPVRNRVIAAAALGVVVVRAALRSGSLITARLAADLGREVLAVPGSVFAPLSAGTHRLLVDGAGVAATTRDVLDALLGPSAAFELLRDRATGAETTDQGAKPKTKETGVKRKLLEALGEARERDPDELVEATGCGVDEVLAALLELELTGTVRKLPGGKYAARTG